MTQTVNGNKRDTKKQPQRLHRPGQRQQERLSRLERRRRRQRLWTSGITAVVIIALSVFGFIEYQRYSSSQLAAQQATATAIANRVAATATAIAAKDATATTEALAQNCFISSTGQAVPAIYAGSATPTAGPTSSPAITGTPVTLTGGLKYVDIKVGSGPAAKKNSKVSVEYTGWLASTCTKFDSSYDHSGQAFAVTVGQGSVIKGWDEGLVGIKAGGIRRLYIPASLGYGAQGSPPAIPANAALIFDIQVLSVK